MPAEFDRDAVFALGHIIALANIVKRVKFHHQMVHPGARPLSESETVMAWVHVHEVDRDRRPNEVAHLEAQKVLIECQGSVDVRHHEHGMAHACAPVRKPPVVRPPRNGSLAISAPWNASTRLPAGSRTK